MASKIQIRSTKTDKVIAEIPLVCADERAAVEFMQKQRWGDHVGCPRCGAMNVYQTLNSNLDESQVNCCGC
jgi:hypothetical protein